FAILLRRCWVISERIEAAGAGPWAELRLDKERVSGDIRMWASLAIAEAEDWRMVGPRAARGAISAATSGRSSAIGPAITGPGRGLTSVSHTRCPRASSSRAAPAAARQA